ncbi:EcoAI/FtnUII family type I restriction enzme subunit R [Aliarcobacter butzleri]|uniref:DEAD/DEAH box helicase family protein n=1 Tax=Aliarcobacter butzleri TaxID=28197 RepID=A0AAP4PX86_9BACT|nr:DEAD/DEAH box helicase family protein [Aliarcobacter butzleri]MCG3705032.1 DEAD/DEAH box helicase family protein [Aliarcobacter butzleri]MDN5051600.1 DEAD/DEAH box helicase family protein [Aliarcobacter butzleri]MDN5074911.1 DEAD/DEAH box helicase family protein [Aliarcobacter butzleri]MDN5115745.1 DEAD/DEAH box helicase family protein [Aliarcobacter butzleri]MDN5131522.1 DEAD/DEAH box helicase family protein [Aliarcobacter butzleri]
MSSKKELTERDICTKYINPALTQAGWNLQTQIREEVYFTDGKIYVKGNKSKRAKGKKADYILYYKPNIPVAIIEAKDNNHRVQDGIQQGLEYANILDIPVVFSSNGDEFYEHDKTLSNGVVERKISLNNFPTPDELWERYKKYKKIETQEEEKIISQDYFFDAQGRFPRYYQQIAINRTVEAIAKGQNRILLVMATGTGKTYTAFQIIHRLWKSGAKKRILFLADRNALIDQTKKGDFRHFKDKMTVIRKKHIDKSYEIYLALYQGLTNYDEDKDAYKEFSSDFFDLIVIDEAHRGSASEDSSWREILDYFSSATQIGLTATPKETKTISNIEYFGESVYTYTLKEGIDDGFLAPYKVLRVGLNVDLEDYEPEIGKKDKDGNEIEQRIYNRKDFDRSLVIDERNYMVAQRVTEFLKATDRFSKTIIFCTDIDHASRMRSAIANLNSDLVAKNSKYVMQITGDNDEGKRELDNFINPQETYPVIATTSKLMTTGVDAQTCKLIVLDSNIGSMTEFKQIIGRGTRINEEYGKTFFTIMDFRGATDKFADPDFDGESVMIKDIFDGDEILNPEEEKIDSIIDENGEEIIFEPFNIPDAGEIEDIEKKKREKVYINGVDVTILNERVQIRNSEGKLITTSYKEYSKQKVHEEFSSLDDFLNRWSSSEKKQVIIDELYEKDILFEELKVDIGKDMDIFDLICHIAYDKPPLTRKERANSVQKRDYFNKYEGKAKEILKALLEKYSDEGIETIETIEVLKLPEFSSFGTAIEIVNTFGGRDKYLEAIKDLENEIYKGVA